MLCKPRRFLPLATALFATGVTAAPAVSPVAVDASPQAMLEAVSAVRAGRTLTPAQWPDGARVAVCITFDVDNEALWRDNPLPVPLSQGEYGAVEGLPRLLALLERHAIPASFYIPVMSAELHPQMIPAILQRKVHEIGVHGWVHEEPSTLDAETEERLMNQAIDYLTRLTGRKPAGFRAPSWDFSPRTLDLVRKAGFLYDSSMMAMDQPYELVSRGKATGLTELPVNWIADDYPYFEPEAAGSLPAPDDVYRIYQAEFDGAYRDGTLFVLTMHPHIIGHRSRAAMLERLIEYMKTKPGVWFATMEQVAEYVHQQQPGS